MPATAARAVAFENRMMYDNNSTNNSLEEKGLGSLVNWTVGDHHDLM